MSKKITLEGLDHFKDKENAMIAGKPESTNTATVAHAVGEYFYWKGVLHIVTAAIAVGGTIQTNTNVKPAVLSDDVSVLKSAYSSVFTESASAKWIQGGYSTANGNVTSSSTRIRCPLEKQCVLVDILSGFKAIIMAYNADGSYVGAWDGTQYKKSATWLTGKHFLCLYGNYNYRLVGAYSDDAAITPADNTGIKVYELLVNSFSPQKRLDSTDDLDNVTSIGSYWFTEPPLNNPLNSNGGIVCVFAPPLLSNFTLQIVASTEQMFERVRGSSSWGNWQKIVSYSNPLYSTDDLNNITTAGTYNFSSANTPANSPILNEPCVLIVSRSGTYIQQTLTSSKNVKSYVRRSNNGNTWIEWRRYVYADDVSFNNQLPVLALTGDTTGMSKDNAVTLDYSLFGQTGTCTVKWQGSSSTRYIKKNYTIKFDTALDGWNKWANFVNSLRSANGNISSVSTDSRWGEQTKFCTKANWVDASMAKNIVCARLWGQIVKSRVDDEEITDGRADAPNYGAIDGFPIEIKINSESIGLYTFNIPKDKWQFAMGTGQAEYVISGEDNDSSACKWKATALVDGTDYSVEYAPEGVEASTIATSLNSAISAAISAGANWETELAPYLDVDSVFDYFIFTCCVSNTDALARNILYGTYDGTKWFMSAYDMDTTFGADPYGSMLFPVVTQRTQFAQAAAMHRLAYLAYTYSPAKLKQRYQELRSTILSEANVWHEFANFVVNIPARCYDINQDIWTTMPGTAALNMANFMEYYRMHCAVLDEEIAALGS